MRVSAAVKVDLVLEGGWLTFANEIKWMRAGVIHLFFCDPEGGGGRGESYVDRSLHINSQIPLLFAILDYALGCLYIHDGGLEDRLDAAAYYWLSLSSRTRSGGCTPQCVRASGLKPGLIRIYCR